MDVVMTFIKTESENVQHGALLAESATNPIIGKMYVVNYLTRRWPNQGQVRGRENRSMVNEISNSAMSLNGSNTVPKQVLDLVDVANSVDNLSHYYTRGNLN